MTGAELQKLRKRLGVTGPEFARAFDVSERTLRRWEAGRRVINDGKPVEVPRAVAILTRLALKDASVRRELGLTKTNSRSPSNEPDKPFAGPRPAARRPVQAP
jgi:transcriptional regulator with XRE-family HTH domain